MKTIKYIMLIFLLAASSCSIFYTPHKLNTPFINDKNQFSITVASGLNGHSFQGAYSPIKNFALISDINFYRPKDTTDAYSKLFSGEIGAGYYKKLKDKFLFNVFTGFGYTSMFSKSTLSTTDTTIYLYETSHYPYFFIQPTLAYFENHFGFGLTAKFNYARIKYSTYDPSVTLPNPYNFYDAEIALTSIMGVKPVYFNLQLGYCIASKQFSATFFPLIFNFGLTLKF